MFVCMVVCWRGSPRVRPGQSCSAAHSTALCPSAAARRPTRQVIPWVAPHVVRPGSRSRYLPAVSVAPWAAAGVRDGRGCQCRMLGAHRRGGGGAGTKWQALAGCAHPLVSAARGAPRAALPSVPWRRGWPISRLANPKKICGWSASLHAGPLACVLAL